MRLTRCQSHINRPRTNSLLSAKHWLKLLQSRDTARFAKAMTPSTEDWKSIQFTNLPIKGAYAMSRHIFKMIELGAKALLDRADALHLDFSKGELHPDVLGRKRFGYMHYSGFNAKAQLCAEKIEIILHPDFVTNNAVNGNFKIAILGMA